MDLIHMPVKRFVWRYCIISHSRKCGRHRYFVRNADEIMETWHTVCMLQNIIIAKHHRLPTGNHAMHSMNLILEKQRASNNNAQLMYIMKHNRNENDHDATKVYRKRPRFVDIS